jgi:transcriptional regulator with XRE-family HTH domain
MKLGTTLAEWRKRAGKSTRDAAAHLECTHQKVSHVEAARNKISVSELRDLCAFYEVPPEAAAEMEAMRRASALPRWWSTYRLPRWFADYVGLEDAAATVQEFQVELIPGLLQIPEYVRSVQVVRSPEEQVAAERAATVRLERQKRLDSEDNHLRLEVVISESALRRALNDTRVGVAQVRHLVAMGQRENIEIQVIPFAAGLHASMSGSFTLLGFEDSPSVGYQEYAVGGHIVDDQDVVGQMHIIWHKLRAQALDVDESLRFLAELTGDAAHHGTVGMEEV